MQSDVDPLQFSPEFEVTIASRRADSPATSGYWIKDMRYTDPQWEPFPWEIEGFDFEPGFEARLLIRPVAEYDDAKGDYEVKYRLTKLISSEEEGFPKEYRINEPGTAQTRTGNEPSRLRPLKPAF